jgi:hypothetical protein
MFGLMTRMGFPASTNLFRTLFLTLIVVDTAFIAIHLGYRLGLGLGVFATFPRTWSIISDYGLPEMFNHLKWLAIVLSLITLYVLSRIPLFASLAAIYTIILADDKLQLHERGGEALALRFDILHRLGMASYQAGEMVIWSLLGSVILVIAFLGYFLTPPEWRRAGKPFLLAFLAVLFFGVGMDVGQEPFRMISDESLRYWTIYALRLVEDGGEMYMTSLNMAVAVTALATYRTSVRLGLDPKPH